MRALITALALGLASISGATSAQALVVIDQTSIPAYVPNTVFIGASVGRQNILDYQITTEAVQTITAGLTGRLDHIDFSIMGSVGQGNILVSLIDGDYASGARTVVGQSTFSFRNPLPYFPVTTPMVPNQTFTTNNLNYFVTPGQKFSVLFDSTPETVGYMAIGVGYQERLFDPSNPFAYLSNYAGGTKILLSGGNVLPPQLPPYDHSDLIFQTFVDTAAGAVPEPATWAMMILGFGMIGGVARRRNRSLTAIPALIAEPPRTSTGSTI